MYLSRFPSDSCSDLLTPFRWWNVCIRNSRVSRKAYLFVIAVISGDSLILRGRPGPQGQPPKERCGLLLMNSLRICDSQLFLECSIWPICQLLASEHQPGRMRWVHASAPVSYWVAVWYRVTALGFWVSWIPQTTCGWQGNIVHLNSLFTGQWWRTPRSWKCRNRGCRHHLRASKEWLGEIERDQTRAFRRGQ